MTNQATTERTAEPRPSWPLWAAIVLPPLLYLIFVAHFSMNVLYADDWSWSPSLMELSTGT